MGVDKATLAFEGRPMLERLVETLADTVDEVVVVARRGQALPPLARGHVRIDPPDREGAGPLAGTLTGLEVAQARGQALTFLTACDMPWVSTTHVEHMLELAEQHGAAVPLDGDGQMQPLACALTTATALQAALRLWNEGQRALRALLVDLNPYRVPLDQLRDPDALKTFNTMAQLVALTTP